MTTTRIEMENAPYIVKIYMDHIVGPDGQAYDRKQVLLKIDTPAQKGETLIYCQCPQCPTPPVLAIEDRRWATLAKKTREPKTPFSFDDNNSMPGLRSVVIQQSPRFSVLTKWACGQICSEAPLGKSGLFFHNDQTDYVHEILAAMKSAGIETGNVRVLDRRTLKGRVVFGLRDALTA